MKRKIITCEIYKKEIRKVLELENFLQGDFEVCTYPPFCLQLENSQPFERVLERLYDPNAETLLLACPEFQGIWERTCSSSPHTKVHNLSYCLELLLNKELVHYFLQKGVQLITPAWLENPQWIRESHDQVLLLDTEVDPSATLWREDFETLPVGLDHLKILLHSLLGEWEKEAIISDHTERIQALNDQVFALNTIACFAEAKSEKQVITTIRALMMDLFSPVEIYFSTGQELQGYIPEELIQWDHTINGFLVSLRHGEQYFGTLVIMEIIYPEHKDRYLDLLYYIAEICGLALTNARAFDEIRRKDEEILKSNERFTMAFEMSPDSLMIYSLVQHKVTYVNQSYERETGYGRQEVVGRDFLFHIVDDGVNLRKILFAEDQATNLQVLFVDRAGQKHEGLMSSKKVIMNEEECLLLSCQDITKINRLQREMNKYARLEAVGEMAASIAHEIRNPMTTVKGYLQLLQDKDHISMYKEKFELMINELDYANRIITDYLSLARNKGIEARVVNLNEVIQSVYSLAVATSHMREIMIRLELSEIPDVRADETELRQLIINLIQNAMDSMERGGTLTVATFISGSDSIRLEVTDEGCGISPEFLEKLGTPFFTTKPMGTGLGLAVCYSIAARYGAKIDFRSDATGTTVSVSFPIALKASQKAD